MPNLFPTLNAPILAIQPKQATRAPQWGREPIWDFDAREFVFNPDGSMVVGNELQTWFQDTRIALIIPRYKYRILNVQSWGYFGSEVPYMLGRNYDESIKTSLAQRFSIEALQYDSRIKTLRATASSQANQLYVTINAKLASGQNAQLGTSWSMR